VDVLLIERGKKAVKGTLAGGYLGDRRWLDSTQMCCERSLETYDVVKWRIARFCDGLFDLLEGVWIS